MFYILILLCAASRLLPHPPNFTPIGALALFAGAYANGRSAWAFPLAALLISDSLLGFYNPLVMAFVYGGFAIGGLLGRRFLRERRSAARIGALAITNSIAFFVISNFGVWVVGMYSHTWEGLAHCYVMAIPFFRNTLLGDLFYTAALFGLYESARTWAARRQTLATS
jgi:hypothetical protein